MKRVFKHLAMAAAVTAAMASIQVMAFEAGDWVVRAGVTTVDPKEDGSLVELDGSTLSLAGNTSKLGVDSSTQLGLTVEYFLTKNWGLELLAVTPFQHTTSGKGELAGLDVVDTKQLPPTLSAVYHFDAQGAFQPYVAAGINYTIFFSEDLTNEADAALSSLTLTGGDVEIDDSWGLSLQAGFDYHLNDNWLVNASVRWIDIDIDIDTEAEIKFDNGSKLTADIDINPYVYTLSVGYKF